MGTGIVRLISIRRQLPGSLSESSISLQEGPPEQIADARRRRGSRRPRSAPPARSWPETWADRRRSWSRCQSRASQARGVLAAGRRPADRRSDRASRWRSRRRRAGQLARAGQRPARLGDDLRRRPVQLTGQRLQRRRRQRARILTAGEDDRVDADRAGRSRPASIPAASLSSRIDTTATTRSWPATNSGSDSASARIPSGLWAPSSSVSGSESICCRRPGTRTTARPPRSPPRVERAQVGLGGGPARGRSCAAERRRAPRPATPGSVPARTIVAPRSAATRSATSIDVGIQAGRQHERRAAAARRRASRRRCRSASAPASACARARRWSAPGPWTGSRWWRRSGRRARPRSPPPRPAGGPARSRRRRSAPRTG